MQITGHITPESLMSLEDYDAWRTVHQTALRALRQLRSVTLGEHLWVQFESEVTIRYQIQEMLRIEKVFDREGIAHEIEAYRPLVPTGSHWKATLMLAYPDVQERDRALVALRGVEDCMYVEVEGHARVGAIADEDMERENNLKTSAVHFLRFELTPAMRAAVKAGAGVVLGCDHAHFTAQTPIAAATLASLADDWH